MWSGSGLKQVVNLFILKVVYEVKMLNIFSLLLLSLFEIVVNSIDLCFGHVSSSFRPNEANQLKMN